jgi:transposase
MSRQVRQYTQEFKEEAVKLVLKSNSLTKTANDLGIPLATINTWVRRLKDKVLIAGSNTTPVNVGELIEENRRLNKELNLVKEEREILKKAAAYFVRSLK